MEASQLILQQIDRLSGRLDDIQRDGSDRGRRLWEKLNDQDKQTSLIGERLKRVEESVSGHSLTLKEYHDLKQKAEGAGWMGRKLWLIGVSVIGIASYVAGATGKISAFIAWASGR